MTHKKLKLSAMLLFGLGLTGLHAQESVNTSGGNASGISGSVSYAVGQVFYTSYTGTNGSVAQGVQQSYQIYSLTGIEEAKRIILLVSAYPNPTSDFLLLDVNDLEFSNLRFQLYDTSGKILKSEKITRNTTRIVLKNLLRATYFLKITQENNEIKTFKIIKN